MDCYTRLYTPSGRVAHLKPEWRAVPEVLCGLDRYTWCDSWRGTGTQTEYETAARLPLCKLCARRAGIVTGPLRVAVTE